MLRIERSPMLREPLARRGQRPRADAYPGPARDRPTQALRAPSFSPELRKFTPGGAQATVRRGEVKRRGTCTCPGRRPAPGSVRALPRPLSLPGSGRIHPEAPTPPRSSGPPGPRADPVDHHAPMSTHIRTSDPPTNPVNIRIPPLFSLPSDAAIPAHDWRRSGSR